MDGWPQNICRCLTKITEVASINHPLPACLPACPVCLTLAPFHVILTTYVIPFYVGRSYGLRVRCANGLRTFCVSNPKYTFE